MMLILQYKNLERLIDLTPRQCKKCKDCKSNKFDMNKYTCKECNAIEVKCEFCSSSVTFSGL